LSRIVGSVSLDLGSRPPPVLLTEQAKLLQHTGFDAPVPGCCGPLHYATLSTTAGLAAVATDPESRITLLFDGLLFNAADIVRDLEDRQTFDTATDASVTLAAYLHWGDAAWNRLSGMFSIAIWDGVREQLLLVVDHFGYKPMHWRCVGGQLLFASEFQPLLLPEPGPQLDALALIEFQTYGDVMPSRSLFKGVNTLPQGQLLRLTRGARPRLETYFDAAQCINEQSYGRLRGSSVESVLDELDGLLNRSIEQNLRGTSRCAIALSGGVDSAILTAIAARKSDVTAVHVSTPQGAGFFERDKAERVSQITKVPLSVVELTDLSYREALVATIEAQAMPLWHLQNVGLYLANQQAAKLGARALLCGDTIGALLSPASQLPWRNLLPALAVLQRLPGSARSFLLKLVSATDGMAVANHAFARYLPLGVQLSDGYARAAREQWGERAYGFVKNAYERRVHGGKLAELHNYYNRFNLRGDRLGYAHGVEYRTPFGDVNAQQFALHLPYDYLVREGTPKWSIKALACRYMPRDLAFKAKGAWDMPGDLFLRPFADAKFFRNGFCVETFGIGESALPSCLAHWRTDHHRLSRMVHTEIWGRLHLWREPRQRVEEWTRQFA
jgi:asparagine synthase (glutamine-hydrolysing)